MLIDLPIVDLDALHLLQGNPGRHPRSRRMDGAALWKEIVYVLVPMAVPGIASTLLLNIILAWNEAFWTLNLTAANAAPLTAFIASFSSPEGPVLGEAVGGLDPRHRANPDPRLVLAEAARARPDLRRSQIDRRQEAWARSYSSGVQKAFGEVNVITDVDLDISDGAVRGLRRAVGLRQVHAAPADRRAGGRHRRTHPDRRRGRGSTAAGQAGLSMVFQSYALYPHMSVYGNIAFPLKMAGMRQGGHRREGARRGARCSTSPTILTASRASSPAASASASPSAAPSCASPRRFSSTSRLSNLDAALRV